MAILQVASSLTDPTMALVSPVLRSTSVRKTFKLLEFKTKRYSHSGIGVKCRYVDMHGTNIFDISSCIYMLILAHDVKAYIRAV